MQIGGSDQWGNIVNGVDLIKRYSNKQGFGLTTPLITLATGDWEAVKRFAALKL